MHPDFKKKEFKVPLDVYKELEDYPRPNLFFADAYEIIASRFNSLVAHKWQLNIINEIKSMLKRSQGLRQLTSYTMLE